jgi:hypothetical protein
MAENEFDRMNELLELTRENNRILRSMHRKQVLGQIATFLYWLVILGVAGWSYYYFKPYMEQYMDMYQNITKSLQSVGDVGSKLPSDIDSLLNNLKGQPK